MIELELMDYGNTARAIRVYVNVPDYNFADQFTLDNRVNGVPTVSKSDHSHQWVKRLAFGSLDSPESYEIMNQFNASVPPSWYDSGFTLLVIRDEFGDALARWEHPLIFRTQRIIDNKLMYFFEIEVPFFLGKNVKDKEYPL